MAGRCDTDDLTEMVFSWLSFLVIDGVPEQDGVIVVRARTANAASMRVGGVRPGDGADPVNAPARPGGEDARPVCRGPASHLRVLPSDPVRVPAAERFCPERPGARACQRLQHRPCPGRRTAACPVAGLPGISAEGPVEADPRPVVTGRSRALVMPASEPILPAVREHSRSMASHRNDPPWGADAARDDNDHKGSPMGSFVVTLRPRASYRPCAPVIVMAAGFDIVGQVGGGQHAPTAPAAGRRDDRRP